MGVGRISDFFKRFTGLARPPEALQEWLRKAGLMESISGLLADELRRQGLSDSTSDFLLDHASLVQANISDPQLRRRLSA